MAYKAGEVAVLEERWEEITSKLGRLPHHERRPVNVPRDDVIGSRILDKHVGLEQKRRWSRLSSSFEEEAFIIICYFHFGVCKKKERMNKRRREEGQLRTPNPNNRSPTRLHSSWELQDLNSFSLFLSLAIPISLTINK